MTEMISMVMRSIVLADIIMVLVAFIVFVDFWNLFGTSSAQIYAQLMHKI